MKTSIILTAACLWFTGASYGQDAGTAATKLRQALATGDESAVSDLTQAIFKREHYDELRDLAEQYPKAKENARVQLCLGLMYQRGQGVEQNDFEAVEWYSKAAGQGLAEAQNHLANMYLNGYGVTQDPAEAAKWYRKAADQGNPAGQYALAVLYQNGTGVERDDATALRLYEKTLAETGYSEILARLHEIYADRLKTSADKDEAVRWIVENSNRDKPNVWSILGDMYQHGYGVARDDAEAVRWLVKAVAQEEYGAQENLYEIYAARLAKDGEDEAVRWIAQLTGQKEAEVWAIFGDMHQHEEDYADAVKWYRKSAEQGHARAQYELAWMYEEGQGVERDVAEAVKWYRKAADQGDDYAKEALERLGRQN